MAHACSLSAEFKVSSLTVSDELPKTRSCRTDKLTDMQGRIQVFQGQQKLLSVHSLDTYSSSNTRTLFLTPSHSGVEKAGKVLQNIVSAVGPLATSIPPTAVTCIPGSLVVIRGPCRVTGAMMGKIFKPLTFPITYHFRAEAEITVSSIATLTCGG
ncbi:hypothetical protein NQZ68_017149 [Dissostichus eleginoides]|nr:hypothetical protein NQZ68_017149 [Dissostichus eleginoides]